MERLRPFEITDHPLLWGAYQEITDLRSGAESLSGWHPGFSVMRIVDNAGTVGWVDLADKHRVDEPVAAASGLSVRDELHAVASEGRLDQYFLRTWYTETGPLRYVVDLLGSGSVATGSHGYVLGSRNVLGADTGGYPHSFHLLVVAAVGEQPHAAYAWGDTLLQRVDPDAAAVLRRISNQALDAYVGLVTGEYVSL